MKAIRESFGAKLLSALLGTVGLLLAVIFVVVRVVTDRQVEAVTARTVETAGDLFEERNRLQYTVLARLASRVISIERIPRLAARARSGLDALQVSNVVVYLGDGTHGRRSDAPFDRILVTAGGPVIPQPLLEQLAPGGALVGPFGPRGEQQLLRVWRSHEDRFLREPLGPCAFVDLIGTHGWAA